MTAARPCGPMAERVLLLSAAAAIFFSLRTNLFFSFFLSLSPSKTTKKNSLGLFSKSAALLYSFALSPAEGKKEAAEEEEEGKGSDKSVPSGGGGFFVVRHRDHAPLPPRPLGSGVSR